MSEKMDIPEKERAIVLQGGGSLGAYEAGAYRALYESLKKTLMKEEKEDLHLILLQALQSVLSMLLFL